MAPISPATLPAPTGPDPLLVGVREGARMLGLGLTKFHELMNSGDVCAIRVGGRTLITVESLRALIANAPAWKGGENTAN